MKGSSPRGATVAMRSRGLPAPKKRDTVKRCFFFWYIRKDLKRVVVNDAPGARQSHELPARRRASPRGATAAMGSRGLPAPKRNDNFRKKVVVSFWIFSLFSLRSSLFSQIVVSR